MNTKTDRQTVNGNDLYFPVEMIHNPNKTNSEYSRIVTGIIDGEEMHLNYCSPRYELVPNADIFPNIEKVLKDNNIQYRVQYSHIDYVRFYADYVITDKDLAYKMTGTNDTIQPMLKVQHSYNGLTKYMITFGYFRLVCTNGLIIPVQEMKDYNLQIIGKHTAQIINSFAKLDEMLHKFVENKLQVGLAITGKFESLNKEAVLNPTDRIKEVLNAAKITAVENSKLNTVEHILGLVNTEANMSGLGYNGKVTDWLIYNGVNQYINDDDRYKTAPETRMKTDSQVLEFMLA